MEACVGVHVHACDVGLFTCMCHSRESMTVAYNSKVSFIDKIISGHSEEVNALAAIHRYAYLLNISSFYPFISYYLVIQASLKEEILRLSEPVLTNSELR